MFGFHQLYTPSEELVFGGFDTEITSTPVLHAFTMQSGSARMFTFEDTEEGRLALALLLRSETVINVVSGQEVIVTSEHLVRIRSPSDPFFQDRYQLLGNQTMSTYL